jgi:hypothetical protein
MEEQLRIGPSLLNSIPETFVFEPMPLSIPVADVGVLEVADIGKGKRQLWVHCMGALTRISLTIRFR